MPKAISRALRATGAFLLWIVRAGVRLAAGVATIVVIAAIFIVAVNLAFHTPYNVAFRALDPDAPECRAPDDGWDFLAKLGNDEGRAVYDLKTVDGVSARKRLNCAIQTHSVERWKRGDNGGPNVPLAPARYDLAFLEFQENGDPYVLCASAEYDNGRCDGSTYEATKPGGSADAARKPRGQLEALRQRLQASNKNFVVAFVHGWRHTAQIGDGNVADLRVYAAHAARFVADRCEAGDARFCNMRTTAVFVGWRGARTDENALGRWLTPAVKFFCAYSGPSGCWAQALPASIENLAAFITLFDRKPVSEAIAPNALTALQTVAATIGVQGAFRDADLAPCEHVDLAKNADDAAHAGDKCIATTDQGRADQGRMIVFGHSLGGNLLITALHDELLKQVERHRAGARVRDPGAPAYHTQYADFAPPALGNMTVLINPAAEARKWVDIQRAVWAHIAMARFDNGRSKDYSDGHLYFHPLQRPTIISVTSARDWPPGGIRPIDCATWELAKTKSDAWSKKYVAAIDDELARRNRVIDYDWATFDLFPLFKFDFRPLASSMERYAARKPTPAGSGIECADVAPRGLQATVRQYGPLRATVHYLAEFLRVFPFMNTNVEETHTIGHVDPPRPPLGDSGRNNFTGRPLGTTHEVEGWGKDAPLASRKLKPTDDAGDVEATLPYEQVGGPDGQCPVARNWLGAAVALRQKSDASGHGVFWDAAELPKAEQPALRFVHGFQFAGLAAITRATDPFWNIRALDNALAEHDGYMLTSFICAMDQLVLDDPTAIGGPLPP